MVSVNASVRARGAATQNRILEKAVHIASVEGLAAMSLATLAKATAMSKSGLFAHFRSKEALQIAIIDEAERIFMDVVVRPAEQTPAGLGRLRALVMNYVDYCSRAPFEGGCFFAAAAHEFDGRPGPVRERVATFFSTWNKEIAACAEEAMQGIETDLFAFEVVAIGLAVNSNSQLGAGPDRARELGVQAMTALLQRTAVS